MGVSGYYFKVFEDAIKINKRSTSTEVSYPRNYNVISFVKKAPEEHKPRRGKKVSFKLVTVL